MRRIDLIYLLGAGRSGTTLLATLLNNHDEIETLGEMHQFYDSLYEDKDCSCGISLKSCKVWNIPSYSSYKSINDYRQVVKDEEKHKNILKILLFKPFKLDYLNIQEETFSHIHKQRKSQWYLDSSKYIARYLLLKQSSNFNIKGIYLVRDPRGVVHSFQKKVQTSRRPISALIYYNIINFFGELVYLLNRDILKIRYEDLVEHPEQTLAKIHEHIFDEKKQMTKLPEYYKMPHIVGGNRMKSQEKIKINPDRKWNKINYHKKILYYFLAFPTSVINNYKI